MYHYMPGTPYTATIGGTSTSSYLNPNTFAIGENQPGAELSGIKKTAGTDGYFRYSLSALATNSFRAPWAVAPPAPPVERVEGTSIFTATSPNRSAGMAS